MDVFAAGQHAGIADRIAAGAWQHVLAIEGPQQAFHFHVCANLLQAEAQVTKEFVEFGLVDLGEAGSLAGAEPRAGQFEAKALEEAKEPAELAPQVNAAIGPGDGLHHGANGSAADLGNRAVEFHIDEDAIVIALVDVVDGATQAFRQQGGQGAESILFALQGSDVHQGGDRFFGGGRLADGVEAAGQQPAFNLHQLAIDRAHHRIPGVQVELGGIQLGQGHVLVEVALPCRFDQGIDDLHPTGAFPQLLVGAHQFAEFL